MKSPLLLCLTIILLAVAAPALAEANNQGVEREQQTPRVKRSWDWTVEERLNSRFSATEIAERNAAYHQTNHGLVAGSMAVSDPTSADRERVSYVIEGRRNPELFLPHEIFDSLVGAVDPRAEVRLRAQASLAPGIRALGLDDATFWLELEAAAGGYARKRIGSPPANDPTWQQSLCSMRFESLATLTKAVGDETLGRVLYQVVAPQMTFTGSTNEVDPSARLRAEARGCR